MGAYLLVPIHLDALCLETDLSVVEGKCDFSRLPYWDGERDVNPDIANISEESLSHPFQDRGLQLRAGVHLHWALPDALTKGVNKPGENTAAAATASVFLTRPVRCQPSRRSSVRSMVVTGLARAGPKDDAMKSDSPCHGQIPEGTQIKALPFLPATCPPGIFQLRVESGQQNSDYPGPYPP